MSTNLMTRVMITVFFFAATLGSAATGPKRFPHIGDFYYGGNTFADSLFSWVQVGGWTVSQPGFELDLTVNEDFFTGCTSWSDLPSGYDDCPTAGYLEEIPGTITLSHGSYDAAEIEPTDYYVQWIFDKGTTTSSDYTIGWQEVHHSYCSEDSPWCMAGTPGRSGGVLASERLKHGTSHLRDWYWTDGSVSQSGSTVTEPSSTGYNSSAGTHSGYIKSNTGSSFDLYLYKKIASAWQLVASATGSNKEKTLYFNGSSGMYRWAIKSRTGSGTYLFGVHHP